MNQDIKTTVKGDILIVDDDLASLNTLSLTYPMASKII